jgi:hypothetical protein
MDLASRRDRRFDALSQRPVHAPVARTLTAAEEGALVGHCVGHYGLALLAGLGELFALRWWDIDAAESQLAGAHRRLPRGVQRSEDTCPVCGSSLCQQIQVGPLCDRAGRKRRKIERHHDRVRHLVVRPGVGREDGVGTVVRRVQVEDVSCGDSERFAVPANFAVTDLSAFRVTAQVMSDAASHPSQPVRTEPGAGVAVNVTVVPPMYG